MPGPPCNATMVRAFAPPPMMWTGSLTLPLTTSKSRPESVVVGAVRVNAQARERHTNSVTFVRIMAIDCAPQTVNEDHPSSRPTNPLMLPDVQDGAYARIDVVRSPNVLEMSKRRFARAMARSESLDVPGVVERARNPRDLVVRSGGQV